MSGSQSLQEQTGSALSESVGLASPRPDMPRQNSDPTSETPGAPLRPSGREERDRERERDRTAWLREEDVPPKVYTLAVAFSSPRFDSQLVRFVMRQEDDGAPAPRLLRLF